MNTSPKKEFHAVLHIIHGMMEHSARYRDFAGWMAGHGIAVHASDLPGHGKAVENPDELGHIDPALGWQKLLEAVRLHQDHCRAQHPGLPVFMMGHSFGSVIARSFVQRYAGDYPLQGLILSGAMQQPSALLRAGLGVISLQKSFYGYLHRSKLMITLGHGQYARNFSPARTAFDWLSSDPAAVDAYLSDPLCGYACTLGFYRELFRNLLDTWHDGHVARVPKEMPVLLMGGARDPAIRFGKDTRKLAGKYRNAGLDAVEVRLWDNGRHEMLNEVNKVEVYLFVRDWMHDRLSSRY